MAAGEVATRRESHQGEARRRGWAVWPRAAWVSGVVGGGGGHERAELRASFAGGAEHAGVANQMASGRMDDADKSSEERNGLRDEVGAAVGPRALELVRDPAVGGPGEPIVGERGPCAVAGETFERLAIVIGDHDTCVQREAPGPRAEAVGAAHDVGGGGGRQTLKTEVRFIPHGSDYHRLARFLETRTDKIVDWSPGRRSER